MRRWRHPSLSIHGVQGAFAEPGEKTVIPGKVIGKFSIRIVPSMTRDYVLQCVVDHVMKVHEQLNTKNTVKCYYAKQVTYFTNNPFSNTIQASRPWKADYKNDNFTAGAVAIEKVWGVAPDLTREGGSIPGKTFFLNSTIFIFIQ